MLFHLSRKYLVTTPSETYTILPPNWPSLASFNCFPKWQNHCRNCHDNRKKYKQRLFTTRWSLCPDSRVKFTWADFSEQLKRCERLRSSHRFVGRLIKTTYNVSSYHFLSSTHVKSLQRCSVEYCYQGRNVHITVVNCYRDGKVHFTVEINIEKFTSR